MKFRNRIDAGQKLARKLLHYKNSQPIIIALPRGGVPVAHEVARKLHAPLKILVVRKLGAPDNEEYGIGAISSTVRFLDQSTIRHLKVSNEYISEVTDQELKELARREQEYDHIVEPELVASKTAIVIDDGLATGVTAKAALLSIKAMHPKQLIFATPVCIDSSFEEIRKGIDEFVCLSHTGNTSVASNYDEFPPVSDTEVSHILEN